MFFKNTNIPQEWQGKNQSITAVEIGSKAEKSSYETGERAKNSYKNFPSTIHTSFTLNIVYVILRNFERQFCSDPFLELKISLESFMFVKPYPIRTPLFYESNTSSTLILLLLFRKICCHFLHI